LTLTLLNVRRIILKDKMDTNKIITETKSITTFETFEELILDMLNGYPIWKYFGKFETVFKEHAEEAVKTLIRHEIIETIPIKEVKKIIESMPIEQLQKLRQDKYRFIWYRLAPRGVELAVALSNREISLTNLKISEKMSEYANETKDFTKTIKILTWVLTLFGFLTFVTSLINLWVVIHS